MYFKNVIDDIDDIDYINFILDYEDDINRKIKLLESNYAKLDIVSIPSDKDKFILSILAFKDDRANKLFDFLLTNNYSLLEKYKIVYLKIN